jgi:hypothetical protein
MSKPLSIVFALLLISSLVLTACASQPPTQAPTQPLPQATQPAVKETVVVKETVMVKETVIVQPTVAPSATPTATSMARSSAAPVQAVATKTPAPGGKLDFTLDDIEYAPSGPRKGDRKIQLTITLRPKGGVPPYSFVIDPGQVETRINGLTYTFDWHNCGETEPHSIVLYSSDGQKVGPVSFMFDYKCE